MRLKARGVLSWCRLTDSHGTANKNKLNINLSFVISTRLFTTVLSDSSVNIKKLPRKSAIGFSGSWIYPNFRGTDSGVPTSVSS